MKQQHGKRSVAGCAARLFREQAGQSLVEIAVALPVLTLVLAYVIDFGYFFAVAANITSAARVAADYSVQGYLGAAQTTLPPAGPLTTNTSVAAVAVSGMTSLLNASTTATVQVCSKTVGTSGNSTSCSSFGPAGTAYTPGVDPEAPRFLLQRVDVTYTVQPPVPLNFFKLTLLPNLSFHRQVSMRALD